MRGFAFVLAVALIEAVAPTAFAKDKIRLAQSSTVTNCMIDVQCAGCKLPDGLRSPRAAVAVAFAGDPTDDDQPDNKHGVRAELQHCPAGVPDELRPAVAFAVTNFRRLA